jgi:SOS-response transcriptional repressor LexA
MPFDNSDSRLKDNKIIQEAVKLVEDGICVTLPVEGRSMLPFIIGGEDSVLLEKPSKIEIGDVVLAWVEQCRFVVHRIIAIKGDEVTLMGDGNIRGTERCRLDEILKIENTDGDQTCGVNCAQ